MSARTPFIAGNWKMNTTASSAVELARAVADGVAGRPRPKVAVCPPFPWLAAVADAVRGTPVALGAQDCYVKESGAFTGEVSPAMLTDAGCQYVIAGHSERRHVLGEADELINRKILAGLAGGLDVIFCIGELLEERKADQTTAVLERQLAAGLKGLDAAGLAKVVIAYEPVWAIGTGETATPDQAQAAHAFVRQWVGNAFGAPAAEALVIQYGGSVKPDNAADLLTQPDVDGALVGGASLKPDQFLAIVNAA